jgi:hypothetical protein
MPTSGASSSTNEEQGRLLLFLTSHTELATAAIAAVWSFLNLWRCYGSHCSSTAICAYVSIILFGRQYRQRCQSSWRCSQP